MRVLQTIGSHQGLPTAFYYGRDAEGVMIEQIRGQDAGRPTRITASVWQAILEMIAGGSGRTFAVTDRYDNQAAPNRNLYVELEQVLTNGGVPGVNDSLLAYVSAILVHEGTLQLYHGPIGTGREARIVLRRHRDRTD